MFNLETAETMAETIRTRLRERRLRLNLTQADVARAAGITSLTVTRYETRGTAPLLTVLKIAEALDALNLFVGVLDQGVVPTISQVISERLPRRRASRRAFRPMKDPVR